MTEWLVRPSLLAIALALAASFLPGVAAAQVPFACTGEAFIVQDPNAQLSQVDQSVSPFEFLDVGGPAGLEYNNMGFRRTDGFLYAVEIANFPNRNIQIVQIDGNGSVFGLGRPAGLPTGPRFDAGDISPNGDKMYINTVNQDLYVVDLTSLPALPPVTAVSVTGAGGFVFDWTLNSDTGLLYGGDSTQGQLAILDPVTGVRTDLGVGGCSPVVLPDCTAPALPSGTAFGGAWFNAAGRLFIYQNTGVIFEIELGVVETSPGVFTHSPQIVGTQIGPGSTRNDGAACVQNITGAAKQMTTTDDGLPETVTVTYNFVNLSLTEDLFDLTAPEDLTAVFGSHGVDWTFTSISSLPAAFANPSFNGHSDFELVGPAQSLVAGATKTITVEIELLSLAALNADAEFCNQVLVTGVTNSGLFFGDLSTAGLDPDPNGDGSPDEREPACISLSTPAAPAIDLVKTGALNTGGDGIATPGDLINYSFTVTNTGTVTLTDVAVTDPLVPSILCPGGNPIPALSPGASEVCTGAYAITQADINAEVRDNTATATGDDPNGNPVSDQDSHSEPIAQAAGILLIKDGELDISGTPLPAALNLVKSGALDLGGDGVPTPGDLITYSFQVTNTGGVTLTDVTVTDPLVSPIICPSGNPIPSLTPLQTETCSGTYAITQGDVDAGVRDNTATVTGDDPDGNPISAQDSHSEPIGKAASIDLVKTGALDVGGDGEASVGDFIDYTLVVTNTGSVTLSNVTVSDPLMAVICPGGNPIPTMAPGASVTCIGSYAIAQADIDAGVRDNTATADGLDPDLVPVSDSDGHSEIIPAPGGLVPFPCSGDAYIVQNQNAQLTRINQSVNPFVFVPIGGPTGRELNNLGFRDTDGLMYAVEIGSSPNRNIQIVQIDATGTVVGIGRPAGLPTAPRFDAGDVSVDGSTMFITTVGQRLYKVDLTSVPVLPAVTSVGITGGQVGNVFDWAASPFDGMLYGGDSTQGQLAILNPNTGVRTDVTLAGFPSGVAYGGAWFDSAGFLFLYRNNGEIYQIDLAGPTILSVLTGPGSTRNDGAACAAAALEPPPPFGAGVIDNLIGGVGKALAPADKANSPTQADPGDVINYTFEVINTGNVPLTNIVVADPMVSPITCPSGNPIPVLNPGESEICTGSYVITQEDIDNGFKYNIATATGEDPNGDPVEDDDDHTEPIPQVPAIVLVKDGALDDGGDGFGDAGDLINYTFTVTNTGTVTLSNVLVSDPIVSPITCPSGNPIPTMAPGASETCTGSYGLTQADVDAGVRDNTATAAGDDPNGDPVSDTDDHSEPIPQPATIDLVKTGVLNTGGDGVANVGDLIDYTFVVTNTGGVTLTNVAVTDPLVSPITCPMTTLAPGASMSCTGFYVVAQADVDAGVRDNLATATGDDPNGDPVSDMDDHSEPLPPAPAIEIVKEGTLGSGVPPPLQGGGGAMPGDEIFYTFLVTNIGNVTLTNVLVTDPIVSPVVCVSGNPIPSLTPGASELCEGIYVLTQDDIDNGERCNTATATSDGGVTDEDSICVPLEQLPELSLDKSLLSNADEDGSGSVTLNDTLTYQFVATNTGTITLTGVTIVDPLPGLSALTCAPAQPSTLAPGASMTCTATYVVTQADVDAGQIDNTATADSNETGPVSDPETVPVAQTATLALDKSLLSNADEDGSATVTLNDTLTYQFVATNTGTITLTGVTIVDPLPGLSALTCAPAQPSTLAPGASMTCTATYVVTQADVDAGQIDNTATADSNETGPVSDPETVPVAQTATLALHKSLLSNADEDGSGTVTLNDTLTYQFVATNTGTVTLTGVTIVDPLPGLSALTCVPAQPSTLAPGASMTCTATYAVTQADVDAGQIDNTATADSNETGPVSDPETVPVAQTATLALDKSLLSNADEDGSGSVTLNDTLTYQFVATNTGTVTLTGVTLVDPLPGLSVLTCAPTQPSTLAPGASMTCTATYVVTQADVDAGQIDNTATADSNETGPVSDPETVPVAQTATLALDKSLLSNADEDGSATVTLNDTLTYQFVATNTGTVTLTGVTIVDPLPGLSALTCVPAQPSTLASGASMTCTATYVVTQADVDAGQIDNTATADSNETGPVSDPETVPVAQTATLALDKSLLSNADEDGSGSVTLNDTLTYQFVATNTGTITLTGVTIVDPLPGLSALTCAPAQPSTLAPGASMTCTATYVVTQADVDAGQIDNTATADSNETDPVSDPETVPVAQTATLALDKSLLSNADEDGSGSVTLNDTLTYQFVATNTGTITLTGVTIVDPLPGLSALTCAPAQPSTLAPGASMTCTATYVVTQADVDAGQIDNTATADSNETDPVSDPETVPTAGEPAIDLVKDGALDLGGDGIANPGDLISYTFVVTNTGIVTLTSVTVTDPIVSPISCPQTTLVPGESMTCTGTYAITQSDIDAGVRDNTATATGTDPGGEEVSDDGDHSEPIPQQPGIELVKDGALDLGDNGASDVGDLIDYTFTVTNTGNVTLTSVSVTDPLVSPITCPSGNPIPSLAPGASETCSGSYAITQADIDAGVRDNTATATGTPPNGGDPVEDSDDHSEPIPDNPDSVCLPTVVFDTNGGGADLPAGTIVDNEYVALGMHVSTDDPLNHPAMIFDTANPTGGDNDLGTPNQDFGGPGVGAGGGLGEIGANAVGLGKVLIISTDGNSGNPNDHAGGGTLIFQFDFPVFVDAVGILDIDAGEGGTVEAFDAGGTSIASAPIADLGNNSVQTVILGAVGVRRLEVTLSGSGAVSALLFCADPSTIDLVKDGELDLGANGSSDVGDVIDYTFAVTNTGDLPLFGVSVTDPLVAAIVCPSGNPIPALASGASETCTGSYAITQADIDAGVRDNTATATGTDPLDQPVSDSDDHSEPIPAAGGGFCTFTQGGWGNRCRRPDPCSGGNPGCFRDCHFDSLTNSEFGLLSGDMVIGGVDEYGIIDGDACYSILLTSAMAVEDFLPSSGGGGNSPLDDDHVDPLTTASTNLGTQVVAATLNVLADAQGLRFDGESGAYPPGTLGTLIFGDCVSAPLQGLTVNQVLDLAHGVLSSCDPSNEKLIGDLKAALGSFNECFVECDVACSCLSLP